MFMISDKTKSEKEKTLEKKPISFKKNKKGKLVKEKTKKSSSGFLKRITYYLSYKIAIILILWISILYFITGKNQVEIYFIFIFIGMLISRELSDNLANRSLKHRLDAFIVIFILAYIVIIFDKIKDILKL